MKKFIIILLTLPLIATSCLKDDDDKFDKSASERMKEYLDNTSKVLSAAPNGWVVEYYPNQFQDYGGVRMYMKFDATKNTVVIASEAGAADATEESYYSFGEDYGPTLNFDTYNTLFHYYSKPQGTVGSANIGWGGDYEFIIMSVDADKVVLRGKKSKNDIILTPASTADWTADFKAYRQAADKMDEMLSYQLEIGSKSYLMSRDVVTGGYRSRHFTINSTPAVSVGYIYTPTGIKFYEPVTIDNVSISEMTWQDGEFVDAKTGSKITQIKTDYTFEITSSNVAIRSADVSVKPSSSEVYYVIGSYPSADAQTKSDAIIMNELAAKVSMSDLHQKAAKVTLSLKAETEYIACAFAVTIVNGYIYPTSELSKSAPFTTLQDVPMDPAFEAWLGTWTVVSTSSEKTSKPITFEITISENERNKSVLIHGWCFTISREDPECYGIATLKPDGGLSIANEQYLFDIQGYQMKWTNRFHYSGGYNTISGDFTAMTLTLSADKTTATSKEYAGTHPDLGAWNVTGMGFMFFNDAGNYGWFDPADGFAADDFWVGPYKLTKKSGPASVAPKSAVAKAKLDYNRVCMATSYMVKL